MSDNKSMTQIDYIIDAGYHHALEEEKRKVGLSHYILDNIGQLPKPMLIMLAKRGMQEELKNMTIEQVEREFHSLHQLLSQNEKKVADEKKGDT